MIIIKSGVMIAHATLYNINMNYFFGNYYGIFLMLINLYYKCQYKA